MFNTKLTTCFINNYIYCSQQYPCQQGPMVFVEEGAYSTFSYKFLLKDFCSRGFKRSYLINIVCSDKFHLINSWNFISDNLEVVVAKMKADAEKQFNKEHLIHSDGKCQNNQVCIYIYISRYRDRV